MEIIKNLRNFQNILKEIGKTQILLNLNLLTTVGLNIGLIIK